MGWIAFSIIRVLSYLRICNSKTIQITLFIKEIKTKTKMKKQYQSPQFKVVGTKCASMLCASAYGTKSMYEEDLDGSSFDEL